MANHDSRHSIVQTRYPQIYAGPVLRWHRPAYTGLRDRPQRGSSEYGRASTKWNPRYLACGTGTRAAHQSTSFADQLEPPPKCNGSGRHLGQYRREENRLRQRAARRLYPARARPLAREGGRGHRGRCIARQGAERLAARTGIRPQRHTGRAQRHTGRGARDRERGWLCDLHRRALRGGATQRQGRQLEPSTPRRGACMWTGGCELVENMLKVSPPERETDDELTDAVRLVLEMDPLVHADQIYASAR